MSASGKLIAAARTLIRTSPAAGWPGSISSRRRDSGPPSSRTTQAFTGGRLQRRIGPAQSLWNGRQLCGVIATCMPGAGCRSLSASWRLDCWPPVSQLGPPRRLPNPARVLARLGLKPRFSSTTATRRSTGGEAPSLLVRSHRINNGDVVNFGYWPADYGTPGALPDVPVSFTRQDTEGRTVIFQPEIRVAPTPGSSRIRVGAQYWSFPSAGCYVIEATGPGVNQSTKVTVR